MAKEKIKTKNIIQKNTGYIISNPEHSTANDNLQLLRITVTNVAFPRHWFVKWVTREFYLH